MNHLCGLGLEVRTQTVLERAEKPEVGHATSSYDLRGKYLEITCVGIYGFKNATWFQNL